MPRIGARVRRRAAASSPSACTPRRTSPRGTPSRASSAANSPRASRCGVRSASGRSCSSAGGAHNVANALRRRRPRQRRRAPRSTTSAQGLADFRAVAGRLQLQGGAARTAGSSTTPTTPIRVRCARASRCCARCPAPRWLVLGDMAELGEHASDSHAHMGGYARDCGVKRLFAVGPQSSRAVETFGAGGEWFADADSLIRRAAGRTRAGRHGAGQGLAHQPPGARGAGAHGRNGS